MSELADKVMQLEESFEQLETYCEYLERAQDAIHEAQSHFPTGEGTVNVTEPCSSEIEDCLYEAEAARDKIAEVLEEVRDL
tara:strand:+ start:675 stop:917 length:243 start_codon:yes stop_codon:yes gene_type:complete